MNRRLTLTITAGLASAAVLAGCTSAGQSSANQAQQASNTAAGDEYAKFTAAVPYPFSNAAPTDPLERRNLARRLTQLNSKGATNYVYLFTYSGQVLGYYVISGKVSSTGSQMTSTQVNVDCSSGSSAFAACTNDAIGDDGSFGPDEGGQNGVFFFTSAGTLVETNQPWVMSSTPIKLYASVPQLDAAAH